MTRAEINAVLNNMYKKHVVRPGKVNFSVKASR